MIENSDFVQFDTVSNASKLLIVFGYRDQPVGTKAHHRYLSHLNCTKIFLNPGVNKWYQTGIPGFATSFTGIAKRLSGIIREHYAHHELLVMGHSMGGYPALAIGTQLNASRILASVPEVEILQPGSISSQCMTPSDPVEVGSIVDILKEDARPRIDVIVGSMNSFDVMEAARIASLPNVEITTIDSGHETLVYLRDQGKLAGVFSAFLEGRSLRNVI